MTSELLFAINRRTGYVTTAADCLSSSCIPIQSDREEWAIYRDMIRSGWQSEASIAAQLAKQLKHYHTIPRPPSVRDQLLHAGCGAGPVFEEHLSPDRPLPVERLNATDTTDSGADAAVGSCTKSAFCPTTYAIQDVTYCLKFSERHAEYGLSSNALHSGLLVYPESTPPAILVSSENEPPKWYSFDGTRYQNIASSNGFNVGFEAHALSAIGGVKSPQDQLLFIGAANALVMERTGSQSEVSWQEGELIPMWGGKVALSVGDTILFATEEGTRLYHQDLLTMGSEEALSLAKDFGLYDVGEAAAFERFDYNQDGLEDIYLANITGANALFENLGDGHYQRHDDLPITGFLWESSRDVSWIEFQPGDDAGHAAQQALYIANEGLNQFFVRQTDGKYIDQAATYGISDSGRTTVAAWGDFLNSGYPALYLGRSRQENLFYLPVISEFGEVLHYDYMAASLGLNIADETVGAEWLDVNGDGLLDLVVATRESGLYLFVNESVIQKECIDD